MQPIPNTHVRQNLRAIIPYNGLMLTPEPADLAPLMFTDGDATVLNFDKSMGQSEMKNLPIEIILEIFTHLPISDVYKLKDDYKAKDIQKCIQKLAQGIPVTIDEISKYRVKTLGHEISQLALSCKAFYALTKNYRDMLANSMDCQRFQVNILVKRPLKEFNERKFLVRVYATPYKESNDAKETFEVD